MARKTVTQYAVFHNVGAKSQVILYYADGGADIIDNLAYQEAAFMVDLLRNEKPMSYDAERKRLSTLGLEPVGESE